MLQTRIRRLQEHFDGCAAALMRQCSHGGRADREQGRLEGERDMALAAAAALRRALEQEGRDDERRDTE